MKKIFSILMLSAFAASAANVVFNLVELGASPQTNRAVLIKPEWLNPTNAVGLPNASILRSGTNTSVTLSNCPEAVLNIEVMAPPSRMTFSIYVPDTNTTLQAADLRGQGTAGRLDPNRYSWSVRASDARYARLGSAGGALDTNQVRGISENVATNLTTIWDGVQANVADFSQRKLYRVSGGQQRTSVDWNTGELMTSPAGGGTTLNWLNRNFYGDWVSNGGLFLPNLPISDGSPLELVVWSATATGGQLARLSAGDSVILNLGDVTVVSKLQSTEGWTGWITNTAPGTGKTNYTQIISGITVTNIVR